MWVKMWISEQVYLPCILENYYGQMDLRNNALTQPKWFYHIDHYLAWMANLMKIKCMKLFNNLHSLSSYLSISYLKATRLCSNYLDSPTRADQTAITFVKTAGDWASIVLVLHILFLTKKYESPSSCIKKLNKVEFIQIVILLIK